MRQLNTKQKKYLKSKGHNLNPVLHIGKNGITEELIKDYRESLEQHELIKIKVLENSGLEIKEAVTELSEAGDVNVLKVIGKTALLYKRSSDEKKEDKIELPE